jgi:hypothetical protein
LVSDLLCVTCVRWLSFCGMHGRPHMFHMVVYIVSVSVPATIVCWHSAQCRIEVAHQLRVHRCSCRLAGPVPNFGTLTLAVSFEDKVMPNVLQRLIPCLLPFDARCADWHCQYVAYSTQFVTVTACERLRLSSLSRLRLEVTPCVWQGSGCRQYCPGTDALPCARCTSALCCLAPCKQQGTSP